MQPLRFSRGLCLLALCAMSIPPAAADCSVHSGAGTTALLELYTSEGCSSCPPADRWLSGLAARGYAAERVVPLALHVDYWDYIGWQDRYAQPGFAERQRALARLNRAGVVYTPQVLLNGRDHRSWGSAASFEKTVAAINRSPAQASLQLAIERAGTDRIALRIDAQARRQDSPVLFVALYENNLDSAIQSGENSGRQLHHDHVVRLWLGPFAVADQAPPWTRQISLQPGWKTRDLGVAALVQDRATGQVLQAVARALCGESR